MVGLYEKYPTPDAAYKIQWTDPKVAVSRSYALQHNSTQTVDQISRLVECIDSVLHHHHPMSTAEGIWNSKTLSEHFEQTGSGRLSMAVGLGEC